MISYWVAWLFDFFEQVGSALERFTNRWSDPISVSTWELDESKEHFLNRRIQVVGELGNKVSKHRKYQMFRFYYDGGLIIIRISHQQNFPRRHKGLLTLTGMWSKDKYGYYLEVTGWKMPKIVRL
jgi:hypothetical protein